MQHHEEKNQAPELRAAAITPEDIRKMGEKLTKKGGKNVRDEIVSPFEVAAEMLVAVESLTEARRAVRRQMESPLTKKEKLCELENIEDHIWNLERFVTSTACEMVDEGMWKKEEDEK